MFPLLANLRRNESFALRRSSPSRSETRVAGGGPEAAELSIMGNECRLLSGDLSKIAHVG
jgi:hypothetical protein